MSKKIFFLVVLVVVLVMLIYGCNAGIKSENEQLKQQVQSLTAELDEMKNGASNMIVEIRNMYEQKNYDGVIEKAQILHEKHNGSAEDKEAQGYVTTINNQRAAEAKKKQEEEAARQAEAKKKKEIESQKAQQTYKDKYRALIRIKNVRITEPNSAGGVDLYIDWVNNSDKIIKYVYFTCDLYNAVDDPITCDIRGYTSFTGKTTGPIKKGQGSKSGYRWENAWYNYSASYAVLKKIEIEYMDGTKEVIPDKVSVDMVRY